MKRLLLFVALLWWAHGNCAELNFKEKVYLDTPLKKNQPLIFAADIGGTNCDFGFLTVVDDTITLLSSYHYPTSKIVDLVPLVRELLQRCEQRYAQLPTHACFACAGVSANSRDYSRLTNAHLTIDRDILIRETRLKNLLVINDFEAIGYGVDHLKDSDLLVVSAPKQPMGAVLRLTNHAPRNKPTKVVIGAGTGFGFATLLWNEELQQYIPLPSEGGHGDLPVHTLEEFSLTQFLQQKNHSKSVEWEDVLTGLGVHNIYTFLQGCDGLPETDVHKVIQQDNCSPYTIVKYRNTDPRAYKTFELFTTFYGRCAKKAALDALALGGVYIAGGIAAKFHDIFDRSVFLKEYLDTYKLPHIIQQIPVYVITNYDVSLYGAAAYVLLQNKISSLPIRSQQLTPRM